MSHTEDNHVDNNADERNRTPNRRAFIRTAAMIATTATMAPVLAQAESGPALLSETDPIAIGLGYRTDASTVDISKYPSKAGDASAPQLCSNCSLYTATSNGHGNCAAVPGKLVAGPGWCSVWNAAR